MTFVDALPLAPDRGMTDEEFVAASNSWLAAQPRYARQLNELGTHFNMGAGVLNMGYQVPEPYDAGLAMRVANQTISFGGNVYAPKLDNLPFTTGPEFEYAKYRLIQGVVHADLQAPSGAGIPGYSPTQNYAAGTLGSHAQNFLSMTSFMTSEQIADSVSAAKNNTIPAFDLTANFALALEVAKQLGRVLWCGNLLIKVSGANISEGPGVTFDRVGYSSGLLVTENPDPVKAAAGYIALTVRGRPSVLDITVFGRLDQNGRHPRVDGIFLDNIVQCRTGSIRVVGLAGQAFYASCVWDAVIGPVSVEDCIDTISNRYSAHVGGDLDTTNMTVFTRFQVERCGGRVFKSNAGTLCCTFLSFHSEQAKGIPGVLTWDIGGIGCHWIAPRFDGSGGLSNEASVHFVGGQTTFDTPRVEGNISIAMEAIDANTLTFNNPQFDGVAFVTPNQVGTISMYGGRVSRLYTAAIKFRVYGTKFQEVSMGSGLYDPMHAMFHGVDVEFLSSLDSQSAATFTSSRIAGGSLLQGVLHLINSTMKINGVASLIGGAVVLDNSKIICPLVTIDSGYIELRNGSYVQGNLTLTGNRASYCDISSYVAGTVIGWTQPYFATWRPGNVFHNAEYSKNLAMAVGRPTGWFFADGAWRVASILGA